MSALIYLLLTRLKNMVKGLVKKPARLIYVIAIVAILGFTVFAGHIDEDTSRELRDIRELIAGAAGLYTLMFLLLAHSGFSNGGAIFQMPDVNLVFPAPMRQLHVLLYGLLRQIGSSLLLSFFILFQYSWMYDIYGVSYGILLVFVLGYALAVFLGQFVAMVIYSLTSADERKKRVAHIIYIAYIALLLLCVAFYVLKDPSHIMQQVVTAATGPVLRWSPVGGWLGMFAGGAARNFLPDVLLGLGLCAALTLALVAIIERSNADFYEDVIKTAEISQSAITASRQGLVADSSPTNVRVGKTGFGRGAGAEMFYYKHRLENRRSRILILDTVSLIFAAVVIVFALIMKNSLGSDAIIATFTMATYMQIFSVSLGRFNRELMKPYIYLLPEPPMRKMLNALRESLPTAVLEAVIVFVPVYLILGMNVPEMLCCILARISFTFLFLVANVIVMRIWRGSSAKTVTMLLYIFVFLLLAAPGVVCAVIAASVGAAVFPLLLTEALGLSLPFLVMTVSNVLFGLLGFFLCRNMLQYAELNYQ